MKVENFAANLKALRLREGLTQKQIASKIGVSQQAYMKWETDKVSVTLRTVSKIVNTLNVDVSELFKEL